MQTKFILTRDHIDFLRDLITNKAELLEVVNMAEQDKIKRSHVSASFDQCRDIVDVLSNFIENYQPLINGTYRGGTKEIANAPRFTAEAIKEIIEIGLVANKQTHSDVQKLATLQIARIDDKLRKAREFVAQYDLKIAESAVMTEGERLDHLKQIADEMPSSVNLS